MLSYWDIVRNRGYERCQEETEKAPPLEVDREQEEGGEVAVLPERVGAQTLRASVYVLHAVQHVLTRGGHPAQRRNARNAEN
jgi:hypothetical protein